MGLLTDGKGAVESRGDVMNWPSRTTRMGCDRPVEGSMLMESLYSSPWASRMVSRESEFQQAVSVEPQLMRPL